MDTSSSLENGLVQVYTGSGKGKTTAALGLALRACGQGLRVRIIQFMKSGIDYGETKAQEHLSPNLLITPCGREEFASKENPDPIDIELAGKAFELAKEATAEGKWDILILDEINVALYYNLISLEEVLDFIRKKPSQMELVLTGRYAPGEIIDLADLVTEMKEVKHYYQKGVRFRRGIER